MIKASENPDYFIRSIIKYKAGKLEEYIKSYSFNRKNICKCFHFPYFYEKDGFSSQELETLNVIIKSNDLLKDMVIEIVDFYKRNIFFYNQYKHGLSVALRPFGDFTQEQINDDKANPVDDKVVVTLDSLNFNSANKNVGNLGAFLIPNLTESISKNAKILEKENNLMRYVFSPICYLSVTQRNHTRTRWQALQSNLI